MGPVSFPKGIAVAVPFSFNKLARGTGRRLMGKRGKWDEFKTELPYGVRLL